MEKIKIRIIRKKSLGVFPSILVGLIFAGLFSTAVYVFALPYSPGETTNPTCGPTDANCTVTASAAYSFGSNNFSGSGNFTTIGTGSFSSLTLTTTALSVGNGGTGLGSIATGSILGANALNTLSAITSSSGTKYLKNASGTISWDTIDLSDLGSQALTTTGVGTFGSNANVSQLVIKANASQTNTNPLAIFYKSDGTTELLRIHSDNTNNLFIGLNAGRVNSQAGGGNNGLYNTFIGSNAGYANTTGAWNTALGTYALYTNTTGEDNTAIGFDALKSNTIGYFNTAVGSEVMFSNTEGNNNVAMGEAALHENIIGSDNIAIGVDTLYSNTIGINNTAVGRQALQYNTTGNYNSALGRNALNYTKTGSSNTAVGYQAGYGFSNQSFSNNSLFGYQAGFYLKTGGNNVLIGYQAGYSLNNIPGTGTGNVFIGYQAGASETMANNLLYIANSNTATPLIYGDFSTSALTINGSLAITGGISGNLDVTGDISAANLNISTWNAKADYSFGGNNFSGTGGFTTTGLGTFGSLKDTELTSGRIPYATTAGLLTDSANLTYDGTNLQVAGTGASQILSASGLLLLGSNKTSGNDETLTFDFEGTANKVAVTSDTVVTVLDLGTIALSSGSYISGTPIITSVVTSGPPGTSPADGALIVDSGDSGRLYVRYGSAWHYIGVTAGFQIPNFETTDPISGDEIKEGDIVLGMVNQTLDDKALHGVWVKWNSVKAQLLAEARGELSQTGTWGEGSIAGVKTETLLDKVTNVLSTLGVSIENGITKIKELAVEKSTTDIARIKKMEMIDEDTGDIYCTWIKAGEWVKVKGECGSLAAADISAQPSAQEETVSQLQNAAEQIQQVVQQSQEAITESANEAVLQVQQQIQKQIQQQQATSEQKQLQTEEKTAKKTDKEIKEEIKPEEKQKEAPPVIEETPPSPEQPAQPEQPSAGDFIRNAAVGLLQSVWQSIKWVFQASLQGAVKLVPNGIKSFSTGLASFVVQDVKSDFQQLFLQIKSMWDIIIKK